MDIDERGSINSRECCKLIIFRVVRFKPTESKKIFVRFKSWRYRRGGFLSNFLRAVSVRLPFFNYAWIPLVIRIKNQ